MFFTRVGKVLAHVMFWISVIRLVLALAIAYGTPDMETNRAYSLRYLQMETSGASINKSIQNILIALALGVLCEISAKRRKPDEQE